MDDRDRREETDRRWRLWMIAAQAGDAATFEKLLLELLPFVRREVAGRVREQAERDDIVQNVLISLHRADWLRARGRRTRHEVGGDMDDLPEPSVEAPLPREKALSPELEGALAALPTSQREAVELLHVEGLSVAEAAERAGVSPGALKVRAHRGYRALRAVLSRRER
jgi:RNA polymerase sigma-70 factor (ECF subfamily)